MNRSRTAPERPPSPASSREAAGGSEEEAEGEPKEEEKVLISDNKSLCLYGEVMAIGKDVNEIKIGDKIIYEIWGLKSPEIDGKNYHFIREDSPFLLGTIE